MGHVAADITNARTLQQPEWGNPSQVAHVRAILSSCEPLVDIADVDTLRSLLSGVATGEVLVLQAGDCAEDPAECTAEHVRSKSAVLDLLAIALKLVTCKPVLRVGRIAGQFAKPRSSPVERVGDLELPVYRGHMINRPDPDPKSRRPDRARRPVFLAILERYSKPLIGAPLGHSATSREIPRHAACGN